MSAGTKNLRLTIETAVTTGRLLAQAAKNIRVLLEGRPLLLYQEALAELAEAGAWDELNDRFFCTLAFGTGGLRGRTIGKTVTRAERGAAAANEPPEFPCVGTNAMNFYNINRATQGFVSYLREWSGIGFQPMSHRQDADATASKPKLVIACDTRHFSTAFAELTAKVAAENGCDAFVFAGPRSTPELSFAVRHLHANAGVVITASHNPPHDNGYKAYFGDGAQVVEPHASGIIARVNALKSESYEPLPPNEQGKIVTIGSEIDQAYMSRLETLILDRGLVRKEKSLRIVFTPIHGTGAVIIKPMMERLGFNCRVVEEQERFDGNFSTVKSPNPENAGALQLGIDLAERTNADLIVATDPDCDRMGVAVRDASGKMKLLTGNQIGSLLVYYRVKTLFALGTLNAENAMRAVIIKTFVTTDLQKAIAQHYGLRCVETLTGFKYIGAKLEKYEQALPNEWRAKYRDLPEEETRRLRLHYSSFYVFGGEESHGYSGADFVRDKDGNGAAIMFCEVAAYAKSRKLTIDALLDEIYLKFGYYLEKTESFTFEGAEGAEKIKRLLESYVTTSPLEMLGLKVATLKDFERETFRDIEGDEIPKEKMLIFELADRTRVAMRASGTEPKIKYYMFAERRPEGKNFTPQELSQMKEEVRTRLDSLWQWLQQDATGRLAL